MTINIADHGLLPAQELRAMRLQLRQVLVAAVLRGVAAPLDAEGNGLRNWNGHGHHPQSLVVFKKPRANPWKTHEKPMGFAGASCGFSGPHTMKIAHALPVDFLIYIL